MAEINIVDNMNTLFGNLEKLLTTKTVFGEAITVGDTTLIPVVDVTFGLGTGGGSGEGSNKCGAGSGGGGAAGGRMSASALIVIKGDHVQVMPIKKSTNLGKLVDMIPDIVDKCKPCKEKGEEHKED